VGVLQALYAEIDAFVHSKEVVAGTAIAAVVAVLYEGVSGLLLLIAPLAAFLAVLAAVVNALISAIVKPRLGQFLNDLKNTLLDTSDSNRLAAGMFIWQCIAYKVFSGNQKDMDYEAISYAVFDTHSYLDKSCTVNVDSIEVFFDAKDPKALAFVD